MFKREELDDDAVTRLLVSELLSQIGDIESDFKKYHQKKSEKDDDRMLLTAMHTVIAYNSIPDSYENGIYDKPSENFNIPIQTELSL